MSKEQALEILIKLANEVPLKGPDADLRIQALRVIVEIVEAAKAAVAKPRRAA